MESSFELTKIVVVGLKLIQANLPISETLLSLKFALNMCLLRIQNVCEFDSFILVSWFAIIVFQKLTSSLRQNTYRLLLSFSDGIMTVLTVNIRMNLRMCFLRHKISNKTCECRFRVHVNDILNIQTEFDKVFVSSKVVKFKNVNLFKQIFTKLSSTFRLRGTNSAAMHVKPVGGMHPIIMIYRKNKIQRRHSIITFYSLIVRM